MNQIPTDRVIDGVDQSGLLLLGEGKGRRDYAFHYNRANLEAVRKDQIKLNLKPNPGFHFYEVYNLYHDPAERFRMSPKRYLGRTRYGQNDPGRHETD